MFYKINTNLYLKMLPRKFYTIRLNYYLKKKIKYINIHMKNFYLIIKKYLYNNKYTNSIFLIININITVLEILNYPNTTIAGYP